MLQKFLIVIFFILSTNHITFSQTDNLYPFSTNASHITIWNGSEYVPFFMKGINLGIAVPGTFPGELAATKDDYTKWFKQIKEAGFNCIRLYTLHYPRFFEALYTYNLENSHNPLLFIQGVWLEEELSGYNQDLYYLSKAFSEEIEENIDCVHGNRTIPQRFGKAYGTFTTDVSQWCLGYIIGREIHPIEINTTNTINSNINNYNGFHFSIDDASASEVWITSMLDHTVHYEYTSYNTQRPVSCSSWPTLDPLTHNEETNIYEDSEYVDLAKIQLKNAPAGLFISYHAYPYYPDFVSLQSSYQSFSDDYGPNSYLGYLTELKSHYSQFPLIIAEYGVPSSWTIGHYSTTGMNHGGFDEFNQGLANIRLLNSIRNTGCGGGIQFAWIDEWFKRTWLFDPVDYNPESRILWHNIAAPEQNFGLISYEKMIQNDTLIQYNSGANISHVNAKINTSFFELEVGLKNPLDIPDEMWVTFDTYSKDFGESILPSGDTIPIRSEFALHITNYSAKLFVTQAYDIFGIWHNVSSPNQLYHSISTDGAPWEIVRIKNNQPHSDVQYNGNLQVNFDFQPFSSKDAVTIADEKINIKIPWSYLNVVEPNQMKVLHDDRVTPVREDTISDGFSIAVQYKNKWYYTTERYSWNPWVNISEPSAYEFFKKSYFVMKDNLHNFNTPAIAVRDSFYFTNETSSLWIESSDGLLKNDFDLDGNEMACLIAENPLNGQIYLNNDGSFEYFPQDGFAGIDSFKYYVYDGLSLSEPNSVYIQVYASSSVSEAPVKNISKLNIYPNPSSFIINVKASQEIKSLQVFDINGKMIDSYVTNNNELSLIVENYKSGTYSIVAKTTNSVLSDKFVKK